MTLNQSPTRSGVLKAPASSGFSLSDFWYALFRHKWKVIGIFLLGVGAATGLYLMNPPPYVSSAKLLVRYVVESRSVEALGPDGQVRTPPTTTESIVNSEKEILLSLDLCRQVAEALGPERVLARAGGGTNLSAAAGVLFEGLDVQIPLRSSVIKVALSHRDPEIAQQGLQRLIDLYFKRHFEVHRGLGTMDAVLAQQTDQIRSRLVQTDEELKNLRTKAGVLSLDDARRGYTEQISAIRQMILTAEAELAEYRAIGSNTISLTVGTSSLSSTETNLLPPRPANVRTNEGMVGTPTASPRQLSAVDAEAARKSLQARLESLRRQEQDLRDLRNLGGASLPDEARRSYTDQIGRVRQMILEAEADLAEIPREVPHGIDSNRPSSTPRNVPEAGIQRTGVVISNSAPSTPGGGDRYVQYRALLARLEGLHRQEMEMKSIFKDENRSLIRLREQLAEAEAERLAIEQENPAFVSGGVPSGSSSVPGAVGTGQPLQVQSIDPNRVRALEARLNVLQTQLDKQRQEAAALEEFETSLTQLQRKRELDERNYRHFAAGLEQTRFDEALGSGKLANISVVQEPSPAMLDAGKRFKMSGMALAAGLFGGIGLALLIEMMLDHTVRRSSQVETSLSLPFLSSVPRVRLGGYRRKLELGNSDRNGAADGGPPPVDDIPGWSPGHPLRRHIEALRDRTLMHFEGDLRKPKLIGVTSCRTGAGVTTLACGLAAALSETAEGRVLLINLDGGSQAQHPFLIGKEACSVVDVVEAGKRETALIGSNLYVASGSPNANGTAVLHPTNISRMLPKIKMSDYDYVVFDMSTVSPTSISAKLAGMVDLVFMVVESEKDSQDSVKKACRLLAENNANFRLVLNKFEPYIPKWLDHET